MNVGGSPQRRGPMPKSCPECGSAVELAEEEVRLLTGTCPGCGKPITIVSGARVEPGAPSAPEGGAESEETVRSGGPECPECGGPLSITLEGRTLTAACESCDTTLRFYRGREEGDEGEPVRRPSFDRPRRDAGGPPLRPMNARPCRRCGAPLRFTTDESGILTGECDSCGNRFTLPPRSGRGGDRDTGRGRPQNRYGPGRGYRSSGRSPGYRSDRGRYRPRDRDDGAGPPRRRRRRDDDESG